MSDGYRDQLAAALARIDQLERENAALKNLQSGRPATAAELEVVRLEGELRHLDMQWEESVRRNYGMAATERALRRTAIVSRTLPLGLAVVGVVIAGLGRSSGALVALGVFWGTAFLTWLLLYWTVVALRRQRASHDERRAPMVRQIAKLRGDTGAMDEGAQAARLRVGDPEQPEPEDDVLREVDAKERRRER